MKDSVQFLQLKLKLLPLLLAHHKEVHDLEAFAPGSVKDDAHKRELFSIREKNLIGSDFLGFGSSTVGTVLQKKFLPKNEKKLIKIILVYMVVLMILQRKKRYLEI